MNPIGTTTTALVSEETALVVLREAQKSGADYAELFLEDNESTRIEMIDGKVESANFARISGAGVRVLLGTQSAYAYCADINEATLLETARAAAAAGPCARAAEGAAAPAARPRLPQARHRARWPLRGRGPQQC